MKNSTLVFPSQVYDIKENNLKRRLAAELSLSKLFREVDKIYELTGSRIVYIDHEFTSIMLRDFQASCRKYPITMVLREPPREQSLQQFATTLKQNKRDSQLVGEIVGASIGCGAAVLSWIVVVGSLGAIPISGGTSTAVTYLGYTAAAAGTAQCINGLARVTLELANPELNTWLDSREWYTNTALAVDALSLVGVGASGVVLAKTLKATRAATPKATKEVLKGLTRAERKRLTQEIIRLNHPGVSAQVMKTLIGAGKYPKRFSQGQISQALALRVQEAIGASFSLVGSAGSGSARTLAVGVYEATIN